MKLKLLSTSQPSRIRQGGTTLPELMVTSAILGLAVAGFLGLHIFALRYSQTVKHKLSASNDARNAINRLAADIRSAGRVRVGNGDSQHFQEPGLGEPQIGNALEIYPVKGDTNNVIRYYVDRDDMLKRSVQADAQVVLARSVTNALAFTSEDGFGHVLSNSVNNRVIGITMQFCQGPASDTGPAFGMLYDYYQIRNKVTRRALE